MKYKKIYLLILFIVSNITAMAENGIMMTEINLENEVVEKKEDPNENGHVYRFIYIAPDNNMDMNRLVSELDGYKGSGDGPTIFYLVSGNTPKVIRCNMDDDNSSEYENFIKEDLMKGDMDRWIVNPLSDRKNILTLLSKYDFLDDKGELIYKEVQILFHVGKSFWKEGYNKEVIAPLFFELNAVKYLEQGMIFRVFLRGSEVDVDIDSLFGDMNFDNINKNKKANNIQLTK